MSSQRKNKRRPVYARARGSPPPSQTDLEPSFVVAAAEDQATPELPCTADMMGILYNAMRNTGLSWAPISVPVPTFARTVEPTPDPAMHDFTPDPEYRSTIFPELRRLFYRGAGSEPQSPSPAAFLPESDTDSDEESADDEPKQPCGICCQQFSKESLQSEAMDGYWTDRCEKCREKSPLEQRITLVMSQTGSTHEAASAALENCGGDVVSAIMQLTC